ncbi:lantibiotic dehydratase family protein [Brevibacterium casei]|uniref:lantibiotic dehydratase family protein n=1 Tax=Brevibacterium casei TaxID=33889 RepID=UPI00223BCB44|nr:lantibiotic dehydratase family protein [Brevibacterium casei]MCT1549648.1 lantibiotic dehydratase family protein [Brevibacterium casei]MCT1559185.1 lantibiotic dehydratase family protein [Brevibacterium casei]MCT2207613.1 lantibiotic dehydratase family protein [Brevibacterium casei]
MSSSPHLVKLPHGGWQIWRQAVLRGAGFPVSLVEKLADHQLIAAADQALAGGSSVDFSEAYRVAEIRCHGVLQSIAADDMFREAVAWQNPSLIENCLDRLVAASRQKPSIRRYREALVARYVQRYAVKNDSIGFFGPILWVDINPDHLRTTVAPLPGLAGNSGAGLSERQVNSEFWAIEALAEVIENLPGVAEELPLRRHAGAWLDCGILRMPDGRLRELTALEGAVWRKADGLNIDELVAMIELQGHPDKFAIREAIARLLDRGDLSRTLHVPIGPSAISWLREQVARLSPRHSSAGLAILDRWERARAEVASCAGNAAAVSQGLNKAIEIFEDLTGKSGYRRPGQAYAARTPLYEDCTRALDVCVGEDVLSPLARPLNLVLESARWFTAYAGEAFLMRFGEIYDRLVQRFGNQEVPLARLLGAATPDLAFTFHRIRPFVQSLRKELWHRWESAIEHSGRSTTAHGLQLSSNELMAPVGQLFPKLSAPWSCALRHSPDVMIAADSLTSVQSGDALFVLGELHASTNTLMSPPFSARHSDPESLLARDAADNREERVVTVPSRSSSLVNSRTFPPVEPLPQVHRWTSHSDHTGSIRPPTPAAELVVIRTQKGLVVRSLRDACEYDVLEMLGDQLSSAVMNAFSIFSPVPYQPRVMIDRLVIQRETWRFEGSDLDWVNATDPNARFLQARRWRSEHGIPEQIFFRAPHEPKPLYVDLRSTVFVEIMAKSVRRTARDHGEVVISEALPGPEQCWLTDQAGNRYASELRIVAVDHEPR